MAALSVFCLDGCSKFCWRCRHSSALGSWHSFRPVVEAMPGALIALHGCLGCLSPAVCSGRLDLSRLSAAPRTRLGHFSFECDGAFPAQC